MTITVAAILMAAGAPVALLTLTPRIVRNLPEPVDDPGKASYASLVTWRFLVTVLAGSIVAGGVAAWRFPVHLWPLWSVLGTLGVLLIVIDGCTTYLPRSLSHLTWLFTGGAAVAGSCLGSDISIMLRTLGGGAAWWLFYYVLWRFTGGLGFGDVRLALPLGAVAAATSWGLAISALLTASLTGVIWGLVHRYRRGSGPFPYGPSMLIGLYLAATLG